MYLVYSISFTIFYCLCYFFIPSAENVIPVFLGSYSYIVWLNSDPRSFWKCSLISSAFVLSTVTKSPSSSFALFFSLLFFHPTSSVLSVSLSLALVFLSLYLCVVTFNIFLTVLCKFDSRSTSCSFAVYSLSFSSAVAVLVFVSWLQFSCVDVVSFTLSSVIPFFFDSLTLTLSVVSLVRLYLYVYLCFFSPRHFFSMFLGYQFSYLCF